MSPEHTYTCCLGLHEKNMSHIQFPNFVFVTELHRLSKYLKWKREKMSFFYQSQLSTRLLCCLTQPKTHHTMHLGIQTLSTNICSPKRYSQRSAYFFNSLIILSVPIDLGLCHQHRDISKTSKKEKNGDLNKFDEK